MVVKGELTEDDGHVTPCAVKKLKRRFIELMLTPVIVAFLWTGAIKGLLHTSYATLSSGIPWNITRALREYAYQDK